MLQSVGAPTWNNRFLIYISENFQKGIKMKHSVLIAALLALSLSACGKKEETAPAPAAEAPAAAAPAAEAPAAAPAAPAAEAPAAPAAEAPAAPAAPAAEAPAAPAAPAADAAAPAK
jgi:type IV secretory pathway VirB10-like protein